jgi:voltage-gated potassium channel
MITNSKNQEGLKNPFMDYINDGVSEGRYHYVRITFALSCLIIMFVDTLVAGPKLTEMLEYGCFLFLFDFAYRFYLSNDRIKFLKLSWYDLALCLPFYSLPWLTVGITIRCVKIMIEFVLEKVNAAFISMICFGALLITFATICVMQFEVLPECNIKSGYDAIWWAICTITTVGYGDKFPITEGGRIVSILLMISGIGLFGALVGYVSNIFTEKEKNHNKTIDTIEELSKQLEDLKKTITDELRIKTK